MRNAVVLSLSLFALSASAATVTRGPATQSVDTDSAIVGFRLDQSCDTEVRYGANGVLDQRATAPAGTQHFVTLEGLRADTVYSYEIHACGQPTGGDGTFQSAPVPGSRSVHFAVTGDQGTGGREEIAVGNAMAAANPEFWLALGDNAYESGTDAEYQTRFFDALAPLLAKVPVFPVAGNHDYDTDSAQPMFDTFELPRNNPAGSERYYSFDWGFVHVAALDSNCMLGQGSAQGCSVAEQKAWLEQDLAQSDAPWKIVMFHHPPYSSGEHLSRHRCRRCPPSSRRTAWTWC